MKQEIKQRWNDIQNGIVPVGYKKSRIGCVLNEWQSNKLGK